MNPMSADNASIGMHSLRQYCVSLRNRSFIHETKHGHRSAGAPDRRSIHPAKFRLTNPRRWL